MWRMLVLRLATCSAPLIRAMLISSSERHALFNEDWKVVSNPANPFTMTSSRAGYIVYAEMFRLAEHGCHGAIVEAGVWMGGSSMLMAMAHNRSLAALAHSQSVHSQHRHFWLFDTFEGMPAIGARDDAKDYKIMAALEANANGSATSAQKAAIKTRFADKKKGWANVTAGKWNFGPLGTVQQNMRRAVGALHDEYVHYVVGKVEDTLRAASTHLPERICLLRLDTDFHESTAVELEVLWPRLQPGSLLYVDDYFSHGGARVAVDEWLERHDWTNHARSLSTTKDHPWHLYKAGPFVG